jgi:hypothetical protein
MFDTAGRTLVRRLGGRRRHQLRGEQRDQRRIRLQEDVNPGQSSRALVKFEGVPPGAHLRVMDVVAMAHFDDTPATAVLALP